jgi:hypothetical protein
MIEKCPTCGAVRYTGPGRRGKPRLPSKEKLSAWGRKGNAVQQERRRSKGIDPREPCGDEW